MVLTPSEINSRLECVLPTRYKSPDAIQAASSTRW